MVMFLATDLSAIVKTLMVKFIKPDILQQVTTTEKLIKINIDNKDSHLSYAQLQLGFSTEKGLKESKCSDRDAMEFRMNCKAFIIGLLKKILAKSPLRYSLVRNMSALSPSEMVSNPLACRDKMKKILSVLLDAKKIKEEDCDPVLNQFGMFLDRIPVSGSDAFRNFSQSTQRVDELLILALSDENYSKLLEVVKLLLVLSHGQASVERGFSVNKQVVIENLQHRSLVAQRVVCDYVRTVGGVLNVPVTKELLKSVALARQRYECFLVSEKEKKKSEEQERKRKLAEEQVASIKAEQKRLKMDTDSLFKSADELGKKAENCSNLSLLDQANALRRAGKEKAEKLKSVEEKLKAKLSEM